MFHMIHYDSSNRLVWVLPFTFSLTSKYFDTTWTHNNYLLEYFPLTVDNWLR